MICYNQSATIPGTIRHTPQILREIYKAEQKTFTITPTDFRVPKVSRKTTMSKKKKKNTIEIKASNLQFYDRTGFLILLSGFIILSFYMINKNFIPTDELRLGHDYSLFLPQLLDGVYWWKVNGLFTVPWFTPSYGGGLPNFPNPQSIYYSVPQFLSFILDPLTSVRYTLLIFGTVGFLGFYFLLVNQVNFSKAAGILGGTLFLYNGFFSSRMMIGHLTFHSFMLLPLLMLACLNNSWKWDRGLLRKHLVDILIGGLVCAYMIYSGAIHILPPVYLAIVASGLVIGIINQKRIHYTLFLAKILLTIIIGLAISAAKLNASLSYLSFFPRDLYPLPGIEGLGNVLRIFLKSVFIAPDADFANLVTKNKEIVLEQHEYDFNIGILPLILISIGALYFIWAHIINRTFTIRNFRFSIEVLLFGIFFSIPLILNYYTPDFNKFLKSLFYFKNSSTNIRWFSMYIPLLILLSCTSFDKVKWLTTHRFILGLGGILLVLLNVLILDRSFYAKQNYSPLLISAAYQNLKSGGLRPEISLMGSRMIYQTEQVNFIVEGNELFIAGCSNINPYEPLFGYRRENFPRKQLVEGEAMKEVEGGFLNIKNPACFVFPSENHCRPGDHFTTKQNEAAAQFINYHQFPFSIPLIQRISNFITLLSLISTILLLVFFLLCNKKKS
jgi:hypothetical protein